MKKALFIIALVLTSLLTIGLYVAKIFFPNMVLMVLDNGQLVQIGSLINSISWLYYVCLGASLFIAYWLFLCACKRSWYLNCKEILIVLLTTVGMIAVGFYNATLQSHLLVCSFFILPLVFKFNLKIATLCYFVLGLAYFVSTNLLALPLATPNFLSTLLLSLECFLWLILFVVIFNCKKKKD